MTEAESGYVEAKYGDASNNTSIQDVEEGESWVQDWTCVLVTMSLMLTWATLDLLKKPKPEHNKTHTQPANTKKCAKNVVQW